VVLFPVVSVTLDVWMFVRMSVNTITPGPLGVRDIIAKFSGRYPRVGHGWDSSMDWIGLDWIGSRFLK